MRLRARPLSKRCTRIDNGLVDQWSNRGSDYENHMQLIGCSLDVGGLYQQQRTPTAGEKHDRGRASELGDDCGLPGRNETAL